MRMLIVAIRVGTPLAALRYVIYFRCCVDDVVLLHICPMARQMIYVYNSSTVPLELRSLENANTEIAPRESIGIIDVVVR